LLCVFYDLYILKDTLFITHMNYFKVVRKHFTILVYCTNLVKFIFLLLFDVLLF